VPWLLWIQLLGATWMDTFAPASLVNVMSICGGQSQSWLWTVVRGSPGGEPRVAVLVPFVE
jgi:hypothetical protein